MATAEKIKTIGDLMNTKGFPEFIAKHADGTVDAGNLDQMTEKHGVFLKIEEAVKELDSVLQELAGKPLNVTLDATAGRSTAITNHIEDLAINDTAAFTEILSKIDTYKSQKKTAADATRAVNSLGGLNKVKKMSERGVWGYMKSMATFGSTEKDNLADKVSAVEKAMKERAKGREELLGLLSGIDALKTELATKASAELNNLLSGATNYDGLKKAKDYFDKMRSLNGGEYYDATALGGIDQEQLGQDLSNELELHAKEKILDTVKNLPLGTGAFSKLDTALGEFKKSVGSKEGDDAIEFLTTSLQELIDGSKGPLDTDPTAEKTKKVLLTALIAHIN